MSGPKTFCMLVCSQPLTAGESDAFFGPGPTEMGGSLFGNLGVPFSMGSVDCMPALCAVKCFIGRMKEKTDGGSRLSFGLCGCPFGSLYPDAEGRTGRDLAQVIF